MLILFVFFFLFGHWLKRIPVSFNSMLVNRIIRLVSFLFFICKFLFIYLSIVNGFRFCCFVLCMQKMAWIREFLQKFTNFKMKINLISIIYKIFVYGLFVYLVGILDFGYLLVFDFGKCKYAQLHIIFSKSACTLHCKVHILLLFCDWI